MIPKALRKWAAFALAWLGYALQRLGDAMLILARRLHEEWR
jgi:hypothetical protein